MLVAVGGLAASAALGVVAWRTGRSSVALIPVAWIAVCEAALYLSGDLYHRISEETQLAVLFWSVIAVVGALVGAIVNRATSKRSPPVYTSPRHSNCGLGHRRRSRSVGKATPQPRD